MKLIAETAWHHQGEFDFMMQLVSELSFKSKVDIVKLHLTIDIQEYMAPNHPLYDKLCKWMLDKTQWNEIIDIILASKKELMLLFNDSRAIEYGMQFTPSHVEIHSVCLNDIHLLNELKRNLNTGTIVVLGVGGSNLYEIENALELLQWPNIVLMFGFQNYPTNYKDINFFKMRKLMKLFPEYRFGYADHTAWDEPSNIMISLMGAALGMDYVEKHVTTVYGKERVDWSAAISIEMVNEIKEKMDILDSCNGDGLLRMNKGERDYSVFGPMKKAALFSRDVTKGEILSKDMLVFKRIGQNTDLSQVEVLHSIGKPLSGDFKADTILNRGCFDGDKL